MYAVYCKTLSNRGALTWVNGEQKKMNFEEVVKQSGKPVVFKKDQHLFNQGDNNNALFLVQSGLLKAYYVSSDGKERIKSFITPGNTIGSLSSAHAGNASSFSLLALKDSALIELPFERLFDAAHESHEVAKKVLDLLLQLAMKKERREYEFLCLSPEERYQQLLARSPELFAEVTQADIACYLGITPVALSRIKNRVAKAT